MRLLLMITAAQCKDTDVSVKLQSVVPPGQKASILFYGSGGFPESEGKEERLGHMPATLSRILKYQPFHFGVGKTFTWFKIKYA